MFLLQDRLANDLPVDGLSMQQQHAIFALRLLPAERITQAEPLHSAHFAFVQDMEWCFASRWCILLLQLCHVVAEWC